MPPTFFELTLNRHSIKKTKPTETMLMKSPTSRLCTGILLTACSLAGNAAAPSAVDQVAIKTHNVPLAPGALSTATVPGNSANIIGTPLPLACLSTGKVPPSGTSGFIGGACATMSGKANGVLVTSSTPNHIVYFDNLAPGNYNFVGSAPGSAGKKSAALAIPAGNIGAACMSARYNSTGGVSYVFGLVTGLSNAPAALCI